MKGYKIRYYVNSNQKRAWAIILTSDETDFKSKIGTRDKERYHIFKKASIHWENITIINRFSKESPEYMKEKWTGMKQEIILQ